MTSLVGRHAQLEFFRSRVASLPITAANATNRHTGRLQCVSMAGRALNISLRGLIHCKPPLNSCYQLESLQSYGKMAANNRRFRAPFVSTDLGHTVKETCDVQYFRRISIPQRSIHSASFPKRSRLVKLFAREAGFVNATQDEQNGVSFSGDLVSVYAAATVHATACSTNVPGEPLCHSKTMPGAGFPLLATTHIHSGLLRCS